MRDAHHEIAIPARAGWRPGPWARAVGIHRTTVYRLAPDEAPRSVTVGRCRVITESPAEYLARIARQRGVA